MSGSPQFVGTQRTEDVTFWFNGPVCQHLWIAGPAGSRIFKITVTTDQSASMPTFTFYRGKIWTNNWASTPVLVISESPRFGRGKEPILAAGSTSTITRTNGSFINDGWTIGQLVAVLNDSANRLNQVVALIHASTAVADATITLASAVLNGIDTMGGGAFLVRPEPLFTQAVVPSSGTVSGTVPQALLTQTIDPGLIASPDIFLELGPNEIFLTNITTNSVTTGKTCHFTLDGGDY